MAEREAPRDCDYVFDDRTDFDDPAADAVGEISPDNDLWDDRWDDFDDDFAVFDTTTWHFQPAPTLWYRTKEAMTALIATAAALVAIVVAGVLLVFRAPGATEDATPSATPTAPTSAAPATVASSSGLPPPPPPPPPPPALSPPPALPPPVTADSPVDIVPRPNYPTVRSREPKKPEFGVTRTPATRSPISVAPTPRRPRS